MILQYCTPARGDMTPAKAPAAKANVETTAECMTDVDNGIAY